MNTRLVAVMQRSKGTEFVQYSTEDISNLFSWINDVIARKAFELYESHGSSPGHDLEDWLRAEAELLHQVPLKLIESNGEYTVRAEVPGFGSADLEIRVEPRCLTILGKRETKQEEENGEMIRSEWSANQIFRTLDLPSEIDTSKVSTTLKDGFLTVALPKIQTAK
jgi:HSP20 family molecular chaperone IbpA